MRHDLGCHNLLLCLTSRISKPRRVASRPRRRTARSAPATVAAPAMHVRRSGRTARARRAVRSTSPSSHADVRTGVRSSASPPDGRGLLCPPGSTRRSRSVPRSTFRHVPRPGFAAAHECHPVSADARAHPAYPPAAPRRRPTGAGGRSDGRGASTSLAHGLGLHDPARPRANKRRVGNVLRSQDWLTFSATNQGSYQPFAIPWDFRFYPSVRNAEFRVANLIFWSSTGEYGSKNSKSCFLR